MNMRTAILILLLSTITLCAQNSLRSSGLGLQVSFWNMNETTPSVYVNNDADGAKVNIAGLGAWINYQSRLRQNWFMEFNLGAVAQVNVEESPDFLSESVDVNSVLPFLSGVRYYLLSNQFPTTIQPYAGFGAGAYFQSRVQVESDPVSESVTHESDFDPGAYMTAGIHTALRSWIGLNAGLRYHFVDFNSNHELSGPEFRVGVNFMWGKKPELFQVKGTRLVVNDIYPAYHQFYSTYPVALVSIKNTAGHVIEVNVRSKIQPYSLYPSESGYMSIPRGEIRDVPVTAVFDPQMFESANRQMAVLDIEVEGRSGNTHIKHVSAQLTVHPRNSWNGEIDKLAYFITADDPQVLKLSREITRQVPDSISPELKILAQAEILFNHLKDEGIRYQTDPNIPFYQDDRVQFATETLRMRSGDCDDLVILYASLLESLGIETAFIQVQDPEKPIAHLYLIFNSGVADDNSHHITSNDKRLIFRENLGGDITAWIPVETTRVRNDFEDAWETGALQFLEEAMIRNGLADGWVQIIDVP